MTTMQQPPETDASVAATGQDIGLPDDRSIDGSDTVDGILRQEIEQLRNEMWVMQSNHTDQLKSIQADHNSETRRLRAEIDKSWQILNKRDEQIVSIKAEFDKAFKDLEQRREEEFLRFQTASDAKARKSLHEKDEYYQRLLEVKINTDIAALRLQQQDTDRKETGDHAAAAGGHADPDSDPSESDSDQADRNKNSDKNRLKAKPDLVGKKKSPSRLGVGERAESADDGDSEGRDRGRRDRHNTDRNRKRAKTRHSGSSSPSPSSHNVPLPPRPSQRRLGHPAFRHQAAARPVPRRCFPLLQEAGHPACGTSYAPPIAPLATTRNTTG